MTEGRIERVLRGAKNLDAEKYDKVEVDFEHPAQGEDDCDECRHWLANDDRCEIVAGRVEGEDWCKKFRLGSSARKQEDRHEG